MIVPMKKATILFTATEAEAVVRSLRVMGVLHVEHQNPPESREIAAIAGDAALIDSTLDVLNRYMVTGEDDHPRRPGGGDWRAIAGEITALAKRREQLESAIRIAAGQAADWERWGDIDLDKVRHLKDHGIVLKLFQVPVKEVGNFPDGVIVRTVFSDGDNAHCVAISGAEFDSAFQEIPPPQQGLFFLKRRLEELDLELAGNVKEIVRLGGYRNDLVRIRADLDKETRFLQVLSGMGTEGSIGYVSGYIPFDRENGLVEYARGRGWGIVTSDPSPDDAVPTLIRNPAWVTRIRPVFDLLGIIPGYHELDISMLFLVFFCIFFGILIGDAGYGLSYILITLALQKMMKPAEGMKTVFSLFYLLGSSAVLWGALTGTFFGQSWLSGLGLRPLVPALNDSGAMQTFCFFLGALHLSIAHLWRAYLKLPSFRALADAGWICILWTAFFLARTLILGEEFPAPGIWLFAAGILLVVLFTSPQKHVLRGIGAGLGTVALSLMNNITDVISYIRLFAVGLATLAIAETTNRLALGFGSGAIALVAGIVILFIGHGLNIILGPMSVLVHGVRLNVLEFSGHANVTWSGFMYEPLSE